MVTAEYVRSISTTFSSVRTTDPHIRSHFNQKYPASVMEQNKRYKQQKHLEPVLK